MSFDLEKYVIRQDCSVEDALKKVEANHHGMILINSEDQSIIALATDGDIRRALLRGVTLKDPISQCANDDFVWASVDCPRENLIKKFDSHIRFIPILDDQSRLHLVISKDSIPLRDEEEVYIRSRAPVRVSFGGGGSDVTHYFSEISGAVINSAISIYSHATMRVRDDSTIYIESLDLGETLTASNLDDALASSGSFGLILAILKVVKPKYGFELYLNSDFPVGSGLGGSATVSAAVLGCFNFLRRDSWDQHELAEIAFQAERLHLGIAGGWQDQYAAVFGGFNFLEFDSLENVIHPMRIRSEILLELEESLVLCDTGIAHHSGDIHKDQRDTMKSDSIKSRVKKNVKLTYEIRNFLLRGHLEEFGYALDKVWRLKRSFSSMISNDEIDEIYNEALENGALGGKLLGAGGGGFLLFYVPAFDKYNLIRFLKGKGLKIQPFRFESDGLQTWKSRVNNTNKLFQGKKA